jgi:hypothetical protein
MLDFAVLYSLTCQSLLRLSCERSEAALLGNRSHRSLSHRNDRVLTCDATRLPSKSEKSIDVGQVVAAAISAKSFEDALAAMPKLSSTPPRLGRILVSDWGTNRRQVSNAKAVTYVSPLPGL